MLSRLPGPALRRTIAPVDESGHDTKEGQRAPPGRQGDRWVIVAEHALFWLALSVSLWMGFLR